MRTKFGEGNSPRVKVSYTNRRSTDVRPSGPLTLQRSFVILMGSLLVSPIANAQVATVTTADSSAIHESGQSPSSDAMAPERAELATVAVAPENTTPSTAEPAARSHGRLAIEEVVVTAQKREENLQNVPISVQAFSADVLDAKGITDPTSLPSVTPGMTYGAITGFTIIFMRGIGSDVFLPNGDASVATYIDGLYFPLNAGLAQSFGSIERIEVLKGPQGTLFGRNTTGGAINILSKDPSKDRLTSNVNLSFATYQDFKSNAEVSGPLTDTLSVSIGGLYNHANNWYESEGAPVKGKLRPIEEKGGRVKVLWHPTDDFEAKLTGYLLNSDGSKFNMTATDVKPIGKLAGVTPSSGDYKDDTDTPQNSSTDVKVGSLDLKYDFGFATAKSISGYQDASFFTVTDFDGSRMPIAIFDGTALETVFTQELQLLSNGTPEWLEWIVGGYYLKSSASFNPQLTALSNNTLFANIGPAGNLLNATIPQATLQLYGAINTEAYAAFSQATWHVTDKIDLTLGGRYQIEKRRVHDSQSYLEQNNQKIAQVFPYGTNKPSLPETKQSNNFSPKVTLGYRLFDDTLLYATAARGFKSGTFNIVNIISNPEYVKPEEVTSYEAGFKSDFFAHRVRLNGAAFRNDLKNSQQLFISLLSGGITHLENAGSLRINGAELELTWQITDSLVFNAGGAYLDGKYLSFKNAKGFDPTTGTFRDNLDLSGNTTVRTPKGTGDASLSYAFDAFSGSWETTVDYYANSGYYFDTQNTVDERPYRTIGARVSYYYEPWRARVTAFGQNLTSEKYYYNRYSDDFASLGTEAPPRTIGVRLNWDL